MASQGVRSTCLLHSKSLGLSRHLHHCHRGTVLGDLIPRNTAGASQLSEALHAARVLQFSGEARKFWQLLNWLIDVPDSKPQEQRHV